MRLSVVRVGAIGPTPKNKTARKLGGIYAHKLLCRQIVRFV
jgi:hypothetical protein